MKKFLFIIFFFSSLILPPSSFVSAQDEVELTLLPNAKHEYRFDYKGDRTQIDIVLEAPEGVELYVFVPNQSEPIGQGSRKGGEVTWSGKFREAGAYRAIVENKTPGPILYSIAFLGESVSGVGQIIDAPQESSADVSTQGGRVTLNIDLPTGARRLQSPIVPPNCTPANALPPLVNTSIKLCANEIYPPLHLIGNNIGLFDDSHSSVINSAGRQFAIVMEGNGNWINGVVIQASPDAADAGAFLCQYEECVFPTQPNPTVLRGGLNYGGGILLLGNNNVVHNSTVRGGTIGVASVDGVNNTFVGNNLSDLNGWGSFNIRSNNSVFVGNHFDRNNHGCTTPDSHKFEHGCETAGWVCLQCNQNLIANNHCEYSGNCYYLSGERGLASNNNRFIGNYCAASPNNCFEFTFSKGNVLQDNIATAHPETGAACKYPFWIGGSTVYFGKNSWGCAISPQDSINDAIRSTNIPTVALALGNSAPLYGTVANAPTTSPPPSTSSGQAPASSSPTQTASAPTDTIAPTPAPTEEPAPCRRRLRAASFFDWDSFTAWVNCVLSPRW